MSEMEQPSSPPPIVRGEPVEVSDGVFVIPDGRVPLVPNVGFVVGTRAVLVVDTGMGPRQRRARARARQASSPTGKPLFLTITHFHPEHGFGAQVFAGEATIVYNRAQRDELRHKGAGYIEMFKGTSGRTSRPSSRASSSSIRTWSTTARPRSTSAATSALLRTCGRAHTGGRPGRARRTSACCSPATSSRRACSRSFPYFPPDDVDVDGDRWIEVLDELIALDPAIVVPGHGEVTDATLIRDVRDTSRTSATRRARLEAPAARPADEAVGRDRAPTARAMASRLGQPGVDRLRGALLLRQRVKRASPRGRCGVSRRGRRQERARDAGRVRRNREHQLELGCPAGDRTLRRWICTRAVREAGFEQVRRYPTPAIRSSSRARKRSRGRTDLLIYGRTTSSPRPGPVADAATTSSGSGGLVYGRGVSDNKAPRHDQRSRACARAAIDGAARVQPRPT